MAEGEGRRATLRRRSDEARRGGAAQIPARRIARAVVDPNVLVSAAISPKGVPAQVVVAAEEQVFEMVASEKLLSELDKVLVREKFRRYLAEGAAASHLSRVRRMATLAEEGEILPVTPDPKDDYLVALARSSRADYIVSGDPHLYELEGGNLPEVLPPRGSLERISR